MSRQTLLLLIGIAVLSGLLIVVSPAELLLEEAVNATAPSTLFDYLLAGVFSLFGTSLFSLRLLPAIAGVGTTILIFFLARRTSQGNALLASFFFATFAWQITLSQLALPLSLAPLLFASAALLLLKAGNKLPLFLIASALCALGIYLDLSFALLLLPLACLMIEKGRTPLLVGNLLWSGVFILALTFPLLLKVMPASFGSFAPDLSLGYVAVPLLLALVGARRSLFWGALLLVAVGGGVMGSTGIAMVSGSFLVALLASEGCQALYRLLAQHANREIIKVAAVSLFLCLVVISLAYTNRPHEKSIPLQQSEYLLSLPPEANPYVVVTSDGKEAVMRLMERIAGRSPSAYLTPADLDQIDTTSGAVIVPTTEDIDLFMELIYRFPQGEIAFPKEFPVYLIPPGV